MKVAVISDIHGNYPALQAVLAEIGDMQIYCAGDLVGYGAQPNEVIEALWERNAICVMGNHDHAIATGDSWFGSETSKQSWNWTRKILKKPNMTYLKHLKEKYTDEKLMMVHGSPKNPLYEYVWDIKFLLEEIYIEMEQNILITGHTHDPLQSQFEDKLIFNPGSVGQPRDHNPDASYAILNTKTQKVKFKKIEYDIETTAEAIRGIKEIDKEMRDKLADRLYLGE